MNLAYLTHPACSEFDPGDPHPEVPARLAAINDHLIALRLIDLLIPIEAPASSDEQLLRVHAREYLDTLQEREPANGVVALDEDTWLAPGALRAARHAAGAGIKAVDLVMAGETKRAFCAVRPPGHHAGRDRAMGFCLFNNIAVAAAHALAAHRLKRVAIVDFDAHWGNGTDSIFRDEKRISIHATFQERLFPEADAPNMPGRISNVPLAAGTGGREIRATWHGELLPALDAFKPQLVMVSAGFDGHRDDAMSDLGMSEDDYASITGEIVRIAERHAKGRVVSMLEGGYDLPSLGRSVASHVRSLLED